MRFFGLLFFCATDALFLGAGILFMAAGPAYAGESAILASGGRLRVDRHDPAQNVDAAARCRRDLLTRYNLRLRHALAAYNAGPAPVEKYHGVPPSRETMNYLLRIEKEFKKVSGAAQ